MEMIHAEEDFERDTGTAGKLMQLFQFRRNVVSGTEIFY